MKTRTPTARLPLILLSAALGSALSGCGDRGGDRSASSASSADAATPVATAAAPASAPSPAPTEPTTEGAGTEGPGAGSTELRQLMVEGMSTPTAMTGDIDQDFAAMMTTHHQTAIRMVDVLLRDGKAAGLKALAEKMKSDQQAEIAQLQPYASGAMHGKPGNEGMPSDEPQAELQRIVDEGKAMDLPVTGDVDKDFATLMTLHHRSGIRMMDVLLQYGRSGELKAMAGKMKAAQQDEIGKMEPFTR